MLLSGVHPRHQAHAGRVDAALMDFRDVLETTGTCRFYRPDPVPDDVLRRVLDGTRWAPTGGNRQGVRFIAVRDPALRRRLADLYLPPWEQYVARATSRPGAPMPRLLANADHFARHLADVPVLIVVCAQLADLLATDRHLDRLIGRRRGVDLPGGAEPAAVGTRRGPGHGAHDAAVCWSSRR